MGKSKCCKCECKYQGEETIRVDLSSWEAVGIDWRSHINRIELKMLRDAKKANKKARADNKNLSNIDLMIGEFRKWQRIWDGHDQGPRESVGQLADRLAKKFKVKIKKQ